MNNLVIGASGQVGEHCLAALNARNATAALGTYRVHSRPGLIPLDITDVDQVDRTFREWKPDVVYLTACIANVDYCELHPELTHETNVVGTRNVVEAANRYGSKIVYMSSEYLFDGTSGPYDEAAATKPLSVYGWQKLAAEHFIATFARDWLIIRTAVVYSWERQGKNFLYRLRNSLLDGREIKVPIDQISSPTYAHDLVTAMIQLVQRHERGVFNVCGPHAVSRYQFAIAVGEAFGLNPDLIVPVNTPDLNQPARRPLKAGLIIDKAERVLGRPMVDFSVGLREMARTVPVG